MYFTREPKIDEFPACLGGEKLYQSERWSKEQTLNLTVMFSGPSQVVFLSFLSTEWLWCFLPWASPVPHFRFPLKHRTQGPLWLCSVQCIAPSCSWFREWVCLLYTPASTSSLHHGSAPKVSDISQGQKERAWGGAQSSVTCPSEVAGRHSSKTICLSNVVGCEPPGAEICELMSDTVGDSFFPPPPPAPNLTPHFLLAMQLPLALF